MHQLLLRSLPFDNPEWIEKCFLRIPPMVNSTENVLEIPEERCTTVMGDALAILSAEMEKGQDVSVNNAPYSAYSGNACGIPSNSRTPANHHSSEMGQMGAQQ